MPGQFKTIVKLAFFLGFLSVSSLSFAQTDIYIRGSGQLFPIALPQLCIMNGQSEANREIPKVMARNLDLSGYFEVLNPEAYIETPGKCAGPDDMAYSDWTVIGAEGLVRGVIKESGGNLTIQMYLHDVQRRKVVLGKEYSGDRSQIRAIAHRFSNEIMRFFTGEAGVFGTQIAFSSRVGRFKELFVMDMDGSNLRQVTNDIGLAVSSSWRPDGAGLVYTSYRNRVPDLFEVDLSSRRVRQITSTQPMEIGAKYSNDGSTLLSSLTDGKASYIVLYDRSGRLVKHLTRIKGVIDVSPTWSPDNSSIAFCSNRAGGPQIYVMKSDGSGVKRVSFVNSNYCTSPAWSPKGDKLAFVCRADRGFQLFISNPDGSGATQLTSYGNNEDPSWSPDGRYLTFATTFGKGSTFQIAMIRSDGSNLRQLTQSRGGDYQPVWGPLIY